MPRGRCIEHGLAIGPDGGCVLCRRDRGPDSKPASTPRVGAGEAKPDSARVPGIGQDSPASSLSPAVLQSKRSAAPPSKPIVIPSIAPPEDEAVVVRIPPAAVVALVVALIAGGAFIWSRFGREVTLFPQAPSGAADLARGTSVPRGVARPDTRRVVAVVMYSGSPCAECGEARRYLNASSIPFVEWDVDQDPEARARYEALGSERALPTFDVGGTVVTGFRAAALEEALHAGAERR